MILWVWRKDESQILIVEEQHDPNLDHP